MQKENQQTFFNGRDVSIDKGLMGIVPKVQIELKWTDPWVETVYRSANASDLFVLSLLDSPDPSL